MADMNLNGLLGFAILFVVVAVAIGLGSNVLQEIQSTQDDDIISHDNVTLTWGGNATFIKLPEDRTVTSSGVLYSNGSDLVGSGNYTLTSDGNLNISNTTESGDPFEYVTSDLNFSFDYKIGSSQRNITGLGLSTQNTFAKWTPTIALVIVIVVIIGVLVLYLARRFD